MSTATTTSHDTGQHTTSRATTQPTNTPVTQLERSAAQRLRTTMAAVRLAFTWLGVRKTLAPEQRTTAARAFHADREPLTASKLILDTKNPAYIVYAWLGNSREVAEDHYLMVTPEDILRAASMPSSIPTPDPTPSALVFAHQESSPENETAVAPAIAKDTAVQIPPRGVEQPADSGRETENPPAPGTESGTPPADPLPELLALVVELPPEAAALLMKIARRLSAAR